MTIPTTWEAADDLADEIGNLQNLAATLRRAETEALAANLKYDVCLATLDSIRPDLELLAAKISDLQRDHVTWINGTHEDTDAQKRAAYQASAL